MVLAVHWPSGLASLLQTMKKKNDSSRPLREISAGLVASLRRRRPPSRAELQPHQLSNTAVQAGQPVKFLRSPAFPIAIVNDDQF